MLKDLLLKYNRPGPRYTSYPPANFFSTEFNADDYKNALVQSNNEEPENISLYFHVPFCPQICHFCGCNTQLMAKKTSIELYFEAMLKEIDNVSKLIDKNRKISQIHWGGGTPNAVSIKLVEKVMTKASGLFNFTDKPEIAMECSPAYISPEYIKQLHELGFNRISLGIQDFNKNVLEAVNRRPPKYPIEEIISDIRKYNFEGINIDLVYGLPLQTLDSYTFNIDKALQLKPDRLVTFSYAHVPWLKNAQKILETYGLPSAEEKLELLLSGYQKLVESGYQSIGMDHFALAHDDLAVAQQNKMLHRNFQGYCTKQTTGQVYAFGSTSISQLHNAYAQNAKDYQQYIKLINESGFATERGYKLKNNQLIVRKVINEIMCNGIVDFKSIANQFQTTVSDIKKACEYNPDKFREFVSDDLLSISTDELQVNEKGMMVVRNIAMNLDPELKQKENMYSKTI